MIGAVVALIGRRVAQAVIGAEVDHLHLRRQLRGQPAGHAVRQRQEREVGVGEQIRRRLAEGQVRQRAQPRVHVAEPLARVAVCARRDDLQIRVVGQQTQQFTTCVATCTGNGDPKSHADDYALRCKFMRTLIGLFPANRPGTSVRPMAADRFLVADGSRAVACRGGR